MIVNVKGVGKIDFPEGMSLSMVKDMLTRSTESLSEEEIVSIVKKIVEAAIMAIPPPPKEEREEREEGEQNVIVNTEAPDMKPIAEALLAVLDRPTPTITMETQEGSRVIDIEVTERDVSGNFKRLRMTEMG